MRAISNSLRDQYQFNVEQSYDWSQRGGKKPGSEDFPSCATQKHSLYQTWTFLLFFCSEFRAHDLTDNSNYLIHPVLLMSTVPSNSASSGVGHSATPWSPEYLSRYDTIVFDCDGVLWHETTPIAGAIRTLERLQELGKRLLFATNNSGKSRETYGEKFTQLGFAPQPVKIEPKQIFTSSMATAAWLKKQPKEVFDVAKQKCFIIGESGIATELRAVGIECIEAQQVRIYHTHTHTRIYSISLFPSLNPAMISVPTVRKSSCSSTYSVATNTPSNKRILRIQQSESLSSCTFVCDIHRIHLCAIVFFLVFLFNCVDVWHSSSFQVGTCQD